MNQVSLYTFEEKVSNDLDIFIVKIHIGFRVETTQTAFTTQNGIVGD